MKFFLDLIFGKLAKSLDGYKTSIGGFGLILSGIVGLIGKYYPDANLPVMETDRAMEMIALGFAALGLGHKIEKSTKNDSVQ